MSEVRSSGASAKLRQTNSSESVLLLVRQMWKQLPKNASEYAIYTLNILFSEKGHYLAKKDLPFKKNVILKISISNIFQNLGSFSKIPDNW